MKRMMFALLAVIMLLSFTACSDNNNNNGSTTDGSTVASSMYVGEWKANTLSGLIDGEKNYTVAVIELNEDGTGTYKGRELTWSYSEELSTIKFTILKENQSAAFEITEVDGKTVLKFFDDIYYRADDFVAIDDTSKSQSTPLEKGTDWETFQCDYYENIPVGLLSTPDATSDIVTKYINEKTGRTDTYEVKQIYNAYHANMMEIEGVFTVYNCKGIARFYFDWAETLYKIEFEFSEDGGITPAIMSKIHDDIDTIAGGKCATNYLIDKGASTPHDEFTNNGMCTCGWHLQEDLNCTARMTSYFSNRPIECKFELERSKYWNKTNNDVSGNIGAGSDSITVGGVTIKGTYHGTSNPYVSGTATNNSSKTVEFIKIKVALKDSSGKVTNTVWTYAVGAEGLAPGETTQWTVYCTEAKDIEISVFN